jgi:hypothetical protein
MTDHRTGTRQEWLATRRELRGRRSPSTGRRTSASRSSGCARHCSSRFSPVADDYQQSFELLTPDVAGAAVAELARADTADVGAAYVLSGAGLEILP